MFSTFETFSSLTILMAFLSELGESFSTQFIIMKNSKQIYVLTYRLKIMLGFINLGMFYLQNNVEFQRTKKIESPIYGMADV